MMGCEESNKQTKCLADNGLLPAYAQRSQEIAAIITKIVLLPGNQVKREAERILITTSQHILLPQPTAKNTNCIGFVENRFSALLVW